MSTSQIYIAVTVVILAVVALLVIWEGKSGGKTRLTPIAGLAFGFILAGLFFGERRSIGYSLLGVGVLLAIIDMVKRWKSS